MKVEPLHALVIGCGRIGAAWDKPGDALVMTHAHAYRNHPRIASTAFVDRDPAAARRAADLWGGRAFDDLDTALRESRAVVASVCMPDAGHQETLEKLLDASPRNTGVSGIRLILAEKPLTTRLEASQTAVRRAKEAGVLVNVNYSRRFDPAVEDLRKALCRGDHGKPLNAVAYYTKGILHNGSHLVDLLRHLLGEVLEGRPLAARAGYGEVDPTLDAWLRLENCPSAHLVALQEDQYSIIEADLLCEKGRIRFTRFGFHVETQAVRQDPIYPGYRDLADPVPRETGFGSAMTRYLEDSILALDEGRPLTCPADDAWRTQKACQDLLEAYRKEQLRG